MEKAVIYPCFGGFSNTGYTTALASMEALKEVGLEKACIGCLGGHPTEVDMVLANNRKAKKIITVDGCPKECAKKLVEGAGFMVSDGILLARDIGMTKKSLFEGAEEQNIMDHINEEDVQKAKELIVQKILAD